MGENIEVEAFLPEMMKRCTLPIFVVYDRPLDFPDSWVVRLFNVDVPTPYYIKKGTYYALRKCIPRGFHNMGREAEDDIAIHEVWV